MAYNFKKMFFKRLVSFLLVFSVVSSTLYLPAFAPKTQAFLGFGDINFEIGSHVRSIVDAIGMAIAQQMIDRMVQSTVKWAQTGFEGNPAYVTDPKQYFTDIADRTAIQFLQDPNSKLGFSTTTSGKIRDGIGALCSPFQVQVRLALIKQYIQEPQYQCTLSGVVANIDAFYNDFSQGGWDGWFSMTQNDSNNPYGAFLKAKIDLDSRIASAIGIQKQQLDWNQGFLSWSECEDWELLGFKPDGSPINGKCEKRGPVQTPGSVIKSQLDKVLPSGLDKLITAQHMDQLVSSFASGLLTRFVFGPKGLFGKGADGGNNTTSGASGGNRTGMIDLDGDGVPDGQDSDYDGQLISSTDTCLHGNIPPDCALSNTVTSSPYFTPVCEAVDGAVATLGEYTKFLDNHADQVEGGGSLKGAIIGRVLAGPVGLAIGIFGLGGGSGADNFQNKADADIWANRTSEANSAVDEVLSRIRDRHSSYFDEMEINTNRFANYLGKVMESLIKDKDLDLARRGNGGGGLENLMKHTAYNLRYFQEVKNKIGKCVNPNISVIEEITSPPTIEELPGEGSGGGELHLNCAEKGLTDLYQNDVRSAANEYLTAHPEIANLSSGNNLNAVVQLREGTISILIDRGFNAKNIPDPSGVPYPQMVGVWRSGDPDVTVYRITAGGGTISAAIQAGYCGGHETFEGVDIGGGGDTTPPPPSGSPPASLQSQLAAEKAKYSATDLATCDKSGQVLEPASCPMGKILNTVAWNNRNAGWGLSRKNGAHRCSSPAGSIACDVLVNKPTNRWYDVFSWPNVTWNEIAPNTDTDRAWVAPAQP